MIEQWESKKTFRIEEKDHLRKGVFPTHSLYCHISHIGLKYKRWIAHVNKIDYTPTVEIACLLALIWAHWFATFMRICFMLNFFTLKCWTEERNGVYFYHTETQVDGVANRQNVSYRQTVLFYKHVAWSWYMRIRINLEITFIFFSVRQIWSRWAMNVDLIALTLC